MSKGTVSSLSTCSLHLAHDLTPCSRHGDVPPIYPPQKKKKEKKETCSPAAGSSVSLQLIVGSTMVGLGCGLRIASPEVLPFCRRLCPVTKQAMGVVTKDKGLRLTQDNSDGRSDSSAPCQVGQDFVSPALQLDFSLGLILLPPPFSQVLIPNKHVGLQIPSQHSYFQRTQPATYLLCIQ